MYKIVGIKEINYFNKKTNRQVNGIEFHCLTKDNKVEGYSVEKVYVSDNLISSLSKKPELNDIIDILYNKYGSIGQITYKEAE